MSFDFSNIAGLAPRPDKVLDYQLDDIEGLPVLQIVHAGKQNTGYFNATLKSSKRLERLLGSQDPQVRKKALEEVLEHDRELYPKFVIKGWSNITDAGGKDVKFSEEACAAFLSALPDFIFMRVRQVANDDFLFGDGGDALAEDVGNVS